MLSPASSRLLLAARPLGGASSGSCSSLLAAAACSLPSSAPSRGVAGKANHQLVPFTKQKIRSRRLRMANNWLTYNDPKLVGKFLRHAERVARETGVADELRSFDAAAAAFPNKPRIIAATVLERNNVVMRDVEDWEVEFLQFAEKRATQLAKIYPQQLLDKWLASERMVGGKKEGGSGGGGDAAAAAGAGDAAASSGGSARGKGGGGSGKGASAESASLDSFYERTGSSSTSAAAAKGLEASPRVTPADEIGDVRSLDRAYTERLVLVVREKATGEWVLPGGEVYEGEFHRQAAERWLRSYFGPASSSSLDVWYVGNSPIGHWLRVYSKDKQEELKCYGEKVFFYRAEILSGRFRLPKEGERREVPFDDFHWLTRDETEQVFARPFFKYAQQMIGSGPGEEFRRSQVWQGKLAEKGVTAKQADGIRVARERRMRKQGLRVPIVATRADAELLAQKQSPEKEAKVKEAVNRYHDRVRETKALSAQLAASMATKPMTAIIADKLALALASSSSSSSAAAGKGAAEAKQ